jgi:hypothetical protein
MTGKRKRLTTVLMATLLMMSMVSVAFTGTVAAQDDQITNDDLYHYECDSWLDTLDDLLGGDSCYNQADVYQVEDSSDSWSTIDSWQNSLPEKDENVELAINEFNTTLKEEGIAVYQNAILNGSNEIEARDKAHEAVYTFADKYAKNMLSWNNRHVGDIHNALTSDRAGLRDSTSSTVCNDCNVSLGTHNVTLPSNEKMEARYVYTPLDSTNYRTYSPLRVAPTDESKYTMSIYVRHLGVVDSDTMGEISLRSKVSEDAILEDEWNDLASATDNAIDAVNTFNANTNVSAIENGETVLPPSKMAEYSANGHSGYTASLLATSGQNFSLETSTTVTHTSLDGSAANYSGVLGLSPTLKESSETDSLSVGDSFNVTEIGGTAYFVDESGTQHSWTDGTVEIIETKGLSENESLSFSSYEYQNVDNTTKTLERLRELASAQENASTIHPGGDEDGGGIGVPDLGDGTVTMVLMVLGGLAVLLIGGGLFIVAMRSGSGSDNYNRRGGY